MTDTAKGIAVETGSAATGTARSGVWLALLGASSVFLSGAGVMVYEFLAIRILQRFLGGQLDVWASEIAVCLGGLAVGYAVGGFLADRFPAWRWIGVAMLVAGAAAFFTEPLAVWIGEWVLTLDSGFFWHPLIAAGVASFVPMTALGTVMPQTVRLTARDLKRLGSATGLLFALSTVGGIVGVLSISPLLLGYSVLQVLYATSAILMGAGLLLVLADLRLGKRAAVAGALVLVLLPAAPARSEVVFERYSAYHHIIVEDRDGRRFLRFDNAVQSIMSLEDTGEGGFDYTEFFHVPVVFNPGLKRALFLGLGGGTGPKAFLKDYPDAEVDVAEIDPEVEKVARKYFDVPNDPRLHIELQDGRVFLRRTEYTYGAILVDAYASGPRGAYLPYYLATREFFQIARAKLEPGGALVYNAVGKFNGMNHEVVAGLLATLRDCFEAVYVYEAKNSINTLLVAVKVEKPKSASTAEEAHWPEAPWMGHPADGSTMRRMTQTLVTAGILKHPHLVDRFSIFAPPQFGAAGVPVLTDDHAPVDVSGGRRR